MENISKIIAITLDRRAQNGANCKVIGFWANNTYIDDPDKIHSIFHTSGIIYSNKIYEYGPNVCENDLIEIIPSGEIKLEAEPNKNIFVFAKQVNKIGTPVIDIPSEYLTDDYLDLESITNFCNSKHLIKEHFTRLYLCDHKQIFGPLKYENNKIMPVIGKESNSFEYHIKELIEDECLENLYLIQEPHHKIKTVDCSTTAQLVDFLKERININRADLNLILEVGKQISSINNNHSGLDLIRLNRAEKYLNQLKLSFEQLHKLGENEDWAVVVKNTIEEYKADFERYFRNGLEENLATIESLLKKKKYDLVNYEDLIKVEQQKLQEIKDQIQIIESKKDEIIANIKIMANIQPSVTTHSYDLNKSHEELDNVEFLNHINGSPRFSDLDEFYDVLKEEFNLSIPNQDKYEDGLILLKESRFLLANSTNFVLNLLSHVGNAQIAIHHAEADWLKFNYWRDSGLLSVIKQASDDLDQHYYYVLQNFNIASFECYGKPILDISNRIRKTIDGVHTFPSNLSIILIRTDEEIDDFGFELNKSTFKNWKCLPNISSIKLIQFPTDKLIDLNKISFYRPSEDYSAQYF